MFASCLPFSTSPPIKIALLSFLCLLTSSVTIQLALHCIELLSAKTRPTLAAPPELSPRTEMEDGAGPSRKRGGSSEPGPSNSKRVCASASDVIDHNALAAAAVIEGERVSSLEREDISSSSDDDGSMIDDNDSITSSSSSSPSDSDDIDSMIDDDTQLRSPAPKHCVTVLTSILHDLFHDIDDDGLAVSEGDLPLSIDILPASGKRRGETDEMWNRRLSNMSAKGHSILGIKQTPSVKKVAEYSSSK